MATASPMVSIAPTRVTNTNAGSRAQNEAPRFHSNPFQPPAGTPTQGEEAIRSTSYNPNIDATPQPTTMPITGDHNLQAPLARRHSAATVTRVTPAVTGAAAGGVPSGTSDSIPNAIGMMVTAISMITVPETTGVRILRSSDSRADRANWNSDETTTRVASSAGPPSTSAATQTAMKAPEVPMMRTCPEPTRPMRTACSTVVIPLTTSAAKMAQVM